MTVYNYRNTGPTYRCLFPEPPPPESVTNCSDGGVLGVIPGIIGSLQALEAIKIIANLGEVMSGKMLLFDGLDGKFRTIKLRPRKEDVGVTELIDYEQFCGTGAHDKDEPLTILDPDKDRISVQDLKNKLDQQEHAPFLLIDVRSKPEMEICSLATALNVPIGDIDKATEDIRDRLANINSKSVFVMCRRGNDSQKAVQKLRRLLNPETDAGISEQIVIKDVIGGLHSWTANIDDQFPCY